MQMGEEGFGDDLEAQRWGPCHVVSVLLVILERHCGGDWSTLLVNIAQRHDQGEWSICLQALADFKERIRKYEEAYDTITDRKLHFIKLTDM